MKAKATIVERSIAIFLVIPVIGLVFMWYNYVLIQWHVSWWQWFILGATSLLVDDKFKHWPLGIIGTISLIAQVLAWMSLIKLPLIH